MLAKAAVYFAKQPLFCFYTNSLSFIGNLKVSFFRPFYGDYKIIWLADDYSVSVVTSGTRDYLWILVCTPQISETTLKDCLSRAEKWNFGTSKLEFPATAK